MNCPIWLDLDDATIVPPLGTRPGGGELNPEAVMVSTEPDFRFVAGQAKKKERESFFMGSLLNLSIGAGGFCVTGPFIGAAYGAMLMESLIARGIDSIIVFGWCGAVSKEFKIGDIILPDRAIADEGVTRNYLDSDLEFPRVSASQNQHARLCRAFEKKSISYKRGTIWTTDAIYRETPTKVDYFKKQGAVAVEMECSALFSVAGFHKKEVAAVLVVSDEVNPGAWKPGFRTKIFKDARKSALAVILDLFKTAD